MTATTELARLRAELETARSILAAINYLYNSNNVVELSLEGDADTTEAFNYAIGQTRKFLERAA